MSGVTQKAAAALKLGGRITDSVPLPAGRTLCLVGRKTGASWILRERRRNTDTQVALGSFPEMSIDAAREKAIEIARGVAPDPLKKSGSVRELIEAYTASMGERRSAADYRWLSSWLFGKAWEHPLASKRAHLVDAGDITELLRGKYVAGGKNVSANRARAMLSAAFNFGIRIDHDPKRPAGVARFGIRGNPVALVARPAEHEAARDVIIPQASLHAIWRDLAACGFGRLVFLTLQRVIQAERATVVDGALIVEDRKGRGALLKTNALPITPRIQEALNDTRLGTYREFNRVLRKHGFRATDIRRTGQTFLGEHGASGEDLGHLLSHGLERSALVRKHYDKSTRLERKRELLLQWESYAVPQTKRGGARSRNVKK